MFLLIGVLIKFSNGVSIIGDFFFRILVKMGYSPLNIFHQVSQVSTIHDIVDIQLVSIVGPGAVGEPALLSVKREEGHVHFARALGDSWGIPHYLAVMSDHHIGVHRASKMIISTERQRKLDLKTS